MPVQNGIKIHITKLVSMLFFKQFLDMLRLKGQIQQCLVNASHMNERGRERERKREKERERGTYKLRLVER